MGIIIIADLNIKLIRNIVTKLPNMNILLSKNIMNYR